ncbi:MAG: 3-phosphoshikimate 1-carboxyvinyltransferase [Frankiales bacterium]|nr:3-phosphoshikimate 1-carboxyvinyltransferase [Frankiales bacterium]
MTDGADRSAATRLGPPPTPGVRAACLPALGLLVTAVADPWPAPLATGPLDAVVRLPGSKSVTNRALVLAALAPGRSLVRRPLRSRDTELMAAGLRTLGHDVVDTADGDWQVDAAASPATRGTAVDVGNAGTVARFLPPVAALSRGQVRFDGDPRVRDRPLGPLLVALRALGADLDDVDALPLTVRGTGRVRGGEVVLDASQSSQLVSGLLLAGARFDDGLVVRHDGGPLPSAPHLAMTVEAVRAAGGVVDDTVPGTWRVWPGVLLPREAVVEPDLSTAAAYLAAPLLAGGSVTVPDWPDRSTQPGVVLPELLARMGAVVSRTDGALTVSAGPGLRGLDVDLRDAGELAPVLTALAALADGPSRLRGIAHLRLHETDRLAALAGEVNALGGDVRETADGLEVRPRPLRAGVMDSHDDHRLAMAWAVLGLAVPGVQVADVATTRKTVPDFVGSWDALLAVSAEQR